MVYGTHHTRRHHKTSGAWRDLRSREAARVGEAKTAVAALSCAG